MDELQRLARFTETALEDIQFFGASGPSAVPARIFVEPRISTRDGSFVSLNELTSRAGHVLLIGAPGSGKTTLLKHLARTLARRFLQADSGSSCPLLVHGNELTGHGEDTSLIAAAAAAAAVRTGDPLALPIFESAIRSGEVTLLVDALDEVQTRERIALVRSLVTSARQPNVLLASRPAHFGTALPDFQYFELEPLLPSDISALAKQWFSDLPGLSAKFTEVVLSNPQIAALAENPLLLELLVAIFRSRGVLPIRSARLLSDAVDYVLSDWESVKAAKRSYLTVEEKVTALEELAFFMISHGETVTYDEAVEIIAGAGVSPSHARREAARDAVSGSLLCRDSRNRLVFVHRTFMEYFCARALLRRPEALVPFVSNREHHEIVLMYADMTDDLSFLINTALNQHEPLLAAKCLSRAQNADRALFEPVIRVITRELGEPFGAYLAQHIRDAAPPPSPHNAQPSLAELWDRCFAPGLDSREKGVRFEAFAAELFGSVFTVVERDLNTESGELDLICEITKQEPFWSDFGGEVVVECKNWMADVPLADVSTFAHKAASLRGIRLAFIVSAGGFTEPALRTLRNQVSDITKPLLVPIDGRSLKQALSRGVDLEEYFKRVVRGMKHRRSY